DLHIANSSVIEERIRANELDLGVVGGHAIRPGEECLASGLVDELVLIVPTSHVWARRREIRPALLAGQRLLETADGSATRPVAERAREHAGITWKASLELGHTEAIKQAVMSGLGVALVSVHAIRGETASGRLRALRLKGVRIRRHFHVIHNEARALTASARAFLDLFQGGHAPGEAVRHRPHPD